MQLHAVTVSALALVAATFVPAADAPRYAPADGTKLTRTITTKTHLVSESMSVSLGDEPIQSGSGGEITIDETVRIVVEDELVKVGKGRPLDLKRKYEEMEGESTQTFEGGGEEQTVEKEQRSELLGKTVRFEWDEEEGEYELSFADDEGDETLLERLDEDLDLRAFLPEADAKEGTTWSVKGEMARILLYPGGDLKLENTEKDEEEEDRSELDHELYDNFEGTIEATYKSTREEDGKTLAVIELKGSVETKGDMDSEAQGSVDIEIKGEVTGEIVWDLTARHLHSASISADQRIDYVMTQSIDMGGESRTVRQAFDLAGTSKLEIEIGK